MHRQLFVTGTMLCVVVLSGCMGGGGKTDLSSGPDAGFTYAPDTPAPGEEVLFQDNSTGSVTEWYWDFGDGEFGTGVQVFHAYANVGVYEVLLQVRDENGRADAYSRFVQVGGQGSGPGGLQADFRYKVAGQSVDFEPIIRPAGTNVEQYFWDFGDGKTSKEPAPLHTYEQKGEYVVELRLATAKGVASTTKRVAVGVASTEPSALSAKSFVVVAVIDSGINPYHEEFAAPHIQEHPSGFINGYPADVEEMRLSLDESDYGDAVKADADVWKAAKARKLYWIPGTKIIGAYTQAKDRTAILDDDGHGTATASNVAGQTVGACPNCLIVAIEGGVTGTDYLLAYRWALAQPWIDVVSNSWTVCAVTCDVNPGLFPRQFGDEGVVEASKAAVERGVEIFMAAGNGLIGAYDAPTPTYYNALTGPDWIVTVGSADPQTGATVTGTGRPFDITSLGVDVKGASHTSTETIGRFSGTSFAAPTAAGAYAFILQGMRERLNDTTEGPRGGGTVAVGELDGAAKKVSRFSIERALFLTARSATGMPVNLGYIPPTVYLPASAAQFAYAGYGFVNTASKLDAMKVVSGQQPAPSKPNEDLWAGVDSTIRRHIWGAYNSGGDDAAAADFEAQRTWWAIVTA